jgi:hypothetical protein
MTLGLWLATATPFIASPPANAQPAEVGAAQAPNSGDTASNAAVPAGRPVIQLQPSLIVPGPMQVPHPPQENAEARPDEAVMFRLNIEGKGYVLLGTEGPDGRFTRLYGGRPDQEPTTGSQLLYDDGKVLAYSLEPHKGESVTFVAALSSAPWAVIPDQLPATPRAWPAAPDATAAPHPDTLLAWDRMTIKVAAAIPTPLPEEAQKAIGASSDSMFILWVIAGLALVGGVVVWLASRSRTRPFSDDDSQRRS